MDWISKLEKKLGKYSVKNLTSYLLICYVAGFFISLAMPGMLGIFTLEPGLILQGQIWRLVSWIIIPPGSGIIVMLFVLLLYYSLGNTLEYAWGAFRYNLYIFSGMLFTVIGAFIVYVLYGQPVGIGGLFSTYYVNMSIFLACAAIMPDLQLLLYGIIPIKMKWLAYLDVALLVYDALVGGVAVRISIIASLLNFIIYFVSMKKMRRYHPKEVVRRQQFKKQMQRPVNNYEGGARHKCAVCGRTELDDENLEFRYCSKCNGNYEYCQDHLFTHEHVK